MELELKYGLNPHQGNARLIVSQDPSPLTLLNGKPGFINLLDAFGAWQLAKELKAAKEELKAWMATSPRSSKETMMKYQALKKKIDDAAAKVWRF